MIATLIAGILPKAFAIIDKLVLDKDLALQIKTELQTQLGEQFHDEQMALIEQQGKGFGNGGWFNDFIDGLNRSIRPLVSLGLFFILPWLIWYGMDNPAGLKSLANSMSDIPTMLWALYLAVFSFWFGGRMFKDWRQFTQPVKGGNQSLNVERQNNTTNARGYDTHFVSSEQETRSNSQMEPTAQLKEKVNNEKRTRYNE